jgi:hypothetical protein
MYDLIVSGQAWHWVDPVLGATKAASLLHPGGRLGVFWNRGWPDKDAQSALEGVYARYAPEIAKTNVAINPRSEPADRFEEFQRDGAFTNVEARTFAWSVLYDRAGWIDLIATHSDHVRLPDARRRVLLDAAGDAVDTLGGTMTYHYSTLLVLATRAT